MKFVDLKTQYELIRSDVDVRLQKVLDHGQYVMGPEVAELESALAAYVGAEHCVTVSSGTDALLASLLALGISAGDEVITTPFTFVATAEAIALLGATPVFVDVDPVSYNIDASRVADALSSRTKAIIPVSLYGRCFGVDAIVPLAAAAGIPVIEDAAQSFGAEVDGRKSCTLGQLGCTSFFPSKPLGCYGDGGACFTGNDEIAQSLRHIRDHGQDRRYHHSRLGINGRLDTLQAAILLAKLALFPEEVEHRAAIGERYTQGFLQGGAATTLTGESGLLVPYVPESEVSVYAQYTIQVDDREAVIAALASQGIPTAVHYPVPLNEQPAFADCPVRGDLAVSQRVSRRVVSLPMHPYLDQQDQDRVVRAVLEACN